jgi:hypothetical protein
MGQLASRRCHAASDTACTQSSGGLDQPTLNSIKDGLLGFVATEYVEGQAEGSHTCKSPKVSLRSPTYATQSSATKSPGRSSSSSCKPTKRRGPTSSQTSSL